MDHQAGSAPTAGPQDAARGVLTLESPIGRLALVGDARGVIALRFDAAGAARWGACPALEAAAGQLRAYFRSERTAFDVSVIPDGTAFQYRVWSQVLSIPFGATRTYGDIAAALGRAGATRAVGRAVAANPVPILIPCHRVVGCNGLLVGYRGGLWRKEWLLAHEGATLL